MLSAQLYIYIKGSSAYEFNERKKAQSKKIKIKSNTAQTRNNKKHLIKLIHS